MYDELRKYIEIVKNVKNKDLITTNLLGISIDKEFMPSVANIIDTDLSAYKIICDNCFVCNPMHVGRDEKLPIALYKESSPAIVSPAYLLFTVKDESLLIPDYLMLLFKKADFDHYLWFHSDSSVRGSISFDDICSYKIPVPSFEEQKRIIYEYHKLDDMSDNITDQKKVNYSIIQTMFLNIMQNERNLEVKKIFEIADKIICGGTPSTEEPAYWRGSIPFLTIPDMHNKIYQLKTTRSITEEGKKSKHGKMLPKDTICVSCIASAGITVITTEECMTNQQINSIICKEGISHFYIYMLMKNMKTEIGNASDGGTVGSNLSKTGFEQLDIMIPEPNVMNNFHKKVKPFFEKLLLLEKQEIEIELLKKLLLFKIKGVESNG